MADKGIGLVEVALEATMLRCDRYAAVLRSGLSHLKPRSATAPLARVTIPTLHLSYPPKASQIHAEVC